MFFGIFVLIRVSISGYLFLDDKQLARTFYECLKQGMKISDYCLKQGQGMRGRAAPPPQGYIEYPPPDRACWRMQTHLDELNYLSFSVLIYFSGIVTINTFTHNPVVSSKIIPDSRTKWASVNSEDTQKSDQFGSVKVLLENENWRPHFRWTLLCLSSLLLYTASLHDEIYCDVSMHLYVTVLGPLCSI